MTLPVYRVDTQQLASDRIEVTGEEGRHAAVVRRTRPGERIVLTDGTGHGAQCLVDEVDKRGLTAIVESRVDEPEPDVQLWVAQAIPKGDHADRAVDLLTEVGVERIIPWQAERNVVAWKGDRAAKGLARWRATAAAAAKQSRRLRWPVIDDPCGTPGLVDLMTHADLTLVLHEETEAGAFPTPPRSGVVLLVVGPEGGITDAELGAFRDAGAHTLRLGPTVLRSSSAGVVAAGALLSRCRW